jgi:hypothetical protein
MSSFSSVKLLDPNKEIVIATGGILPPVDGSLLTNLPVGVSIGAVMKSYTSPLPSISFPVESGIISSSYSESELNIIIDSSVAVPFKLYIVRDGEMREAVMGTRYYELNGGYVYEIVGTEVEGEQIIIQLLSVGRDRQYFNAPAVNLTYIDSVYGRVCHLDSSSSFFLFTETLTGTKSFLFTSVSARNDIGGNIVLSISDADDVELGVFVVPVNTTLSTYRIVGDFDGKLRFTRKYDDERDTLKSEGVTITAVITDIKEAREV